jgi:hypothetical protein
MKPLVRSLMLVVVLLFGIFLCLPKLQVPAFSPILLDVSGEVLCTQLTRDEKWRLPIRPLSKLMVEAPSYRFQQLS